MIRVLIVDDSPVASQMLSHIYSSDPDLRVIGTATNGEEAIRMTAQLKPDIISMDMIMPVMNGLEATRRIMETMPLPIIIVSSSYDPSEVSKSFSAIEAGALSIVSKPMGPGHPLYKKQIRELIITVKALSDVKVVTHRRRIAPDKELISKAARESAKREIRMIAIGASTGGPPVLQAILSGLPKNFPVPVTIVQHITEGFTAGFASWLSHASSFPVRVPENGENYMPGRAYLAPDNVHMVVDNKGRILLNNDPPDNLLKPSVAHLFTSIARVFREKAVGVLLSGMGRDGADGLKMMREAGAITIAQDRESSLVFGMNAEAVQLGAVQHLLPPEGIAAMLISLTTWK